MQTFEGDSERFVRTDQRSRGANEFGVVTGGRAVGEDRDIFKAGADAVSSREGTTIHVPTGEVVAVVNLFERDACGGDDFLHCGGVGKRRRGIGVERFDEDAPATGRQAGTDEGLGIVDGEQTGFERHSAGVQKFAELDNAGFALIHGDEVGKIVPRGDDTQAFNWIGDDGSRGGEGDGNARTERANGAKDLGAGGAVEGFMAGVVKSVNVNGLCSGIDSSVSRLSDG